VNRSERSAWPELAGFVSAQSSSPASLQSFDQVHKNKQKPDPAFPRQNQAIQGTAKAAHDLIVLRENR